MEARSAPPRIGWPRPFLVPLAPPALLGAILLSGLVLGLLPGCSAGWKNLTADQKMEDFNYLFGILRDNHPYLSLKARAEGYDWLSHRQEFEQAVRASAGDKAFAETISWILRQINNGHTGIVMAELAQNMAEWNEEPWKKAADRTSPERIDYWYNLSLPSAVSSHQDRCPPFLAVYSEGQYVVVAVAPDEAIRDLVGVRMTVLEINGRPVQEHVENQRGSLLSRLQKLRFDPIRKDLYQRELALPVEGDSFRVTLRDPTGVIAEVDVPYAAKAWDSSYPWPPRYAGTQGSATPNLYADVLADGQVGYLKIADFFRSEEDTSALRRFFESVRDLPALIIDVRGNPGGQSTYYLWDIVGQLAPGPVESTTYLIWRRGDYVQDFIQAKMLNIPSEEVSKDALVDKAGPDLAGSIPPEVLGDGFLNPHLLQYTIAPEDSVRYQGRIFLLVDDLSYSAADGFAALCKASRLATVVGTWTGGDGIGVTPALVTLPNSGMVVEFPLVMGLNPDFTANEETHTLADVLVEQSIDDILAYLAKRSSAAGGGDSAGLEPDPDWDTALRKCLELALEGEECSMNEVGVNLTIGIDQYRQCVADIPAKGKWMAWLDGYYSQYRAVFDPMLRYLYMADLESMRPHVEAWDFEGGLQAAERFLSLGGVERVRRFLSNCARALDFREEYHVFLLVGIGQVGGTALPGTEPFLYIGVERWADDPEGLAFVVPHEFLHMVRSRSLNPAAITFGGLVIEEGLATAFSIAAQGLPFDRPSMRAALLNMSEQAFDYCESHRDELTKEILSQAGSPVNRELMARYLYSDSYQDGKGMPGNVGYYVGLRIVVDLMVQGLGVRDLVKQSAREILGRWEESTLS